MGANVAGSHYFAADIIGSESLEAVTGKYYQGRLSKAGQYCIIGYIDGD